MFGGEYVSCSGSVEGRGPQASLQEEQSKRNVSSGEITSAGHVLFLCTLLGSDFNSPYLRLHDREV